MAVDSVVMNVVIISLRLSNNELEEKSAMSVSNLVRKSKTLAYLGLGWGKFRYNHVLSIFENIVCNKYGALRFLDLSYNSIGLDVEGSPSSCMFEDIEQM